MTKLNNSNCDKTQKLKLWQNSKTQIVTKLKNSNCYKTQNCKFWQNSNCDKTQKLNGDNIQKLKLKKKIKNSNCEKLKNSNFDTSTTDEMFSGKLLRFSRCYFSILIKNAFDINSRFCSQKYALNKKIKKIWLQDLQFAAFQQSFAQCWWKCPILEGSLIQKPT